MRKIFKAQKTINTDLEGGNQWKLIENARIAINSKKSKRKR